MTGLRGVLVLLTVALGCERTVAVSPPSPPPPAGEAEAPTLPEPRLVELAVGFEQACVRLRDGGVVCWGRDGKAGLSAPHRVQGLGGDVVQLSVGRLGS